MGQDTEQMLLECEAHAEGTIDYGLDLSEDDIGNGPLQHDIFLIELAGRTVARLVLDHNVELEQALRLTIERAINAMEEAEASLD